MSSKKLQILIILVSNLYTHRHTKNKNSHTLHQTINNTTITRSDDNCIGHGEDGLCWSDDGSVKMLWFETAFVGLGILGLWLNGDWTFPDDGEDGLCWSDGGGGG